MANLFEHYLQAYSKQVDEFLLHYFELDCHPEMTRYLYHPLNEYSKNAGKRHRPLICLLACKAVGGDPAKAMTTAASIEHFHTAALIHDDIADESLLRRGKPCMHITEGIGLAINAGDLALSLVNGAVLRDPSMEDSLKVQVVTELIAMTERTIEGQALDLGWARDKRYDISIDDYLVMIQHKTAFYSGAVPLALGALIGGGSEEQVSKLREFGMLSGLAFQIQDDLLNLTGKEEAVKKDFRSDIIEGKRTLMVVHALKHSDAAAELEEILSSKTDDRSRIDRAVEIMQEAGSLSYAHDYALQLTNQAKEVLNTVDIDQQAKELFLSMADFFVERLS